MAAVKRPQGPPEKPVKDVDDEIADRLHGQKAGPSGQAPGAKKAPPPKAVARKPGHVIDTASDNAEEPVAEPNAEQVKGELRARKDEATRTRDKQRPEKKRKIGDPEGERQRKQSSQDEERAPPVVTTTPAHLVHDANYYRSRSARKMGFEQTPSIGDFVTGLDADTEGEALGALLPSARARAHPDLPETDIRPPDFLRPLEAMKDIWMRTRGRMSRRTQELLEGVDLEDLLAMVQAVHDSETLVKKPEARIKGALFQALKGEEDSPLLLGFQDPRLTEVWRLLIDGWEIWVPDHADDEGVELFWEGEGEDARGQPMEIVQSLTLIGGELTLFTKMGAEEDAVTFDGQAFYRLKTPRRSPAEADPA